MLKLILNGIGEIGNVTILAFRVFLMFFTPPYRPLLLIQQMQFVGVGSLTIIALTGSFTGAVIALQSEYTFSMFNAEGMVGATVAITLSREIAAVFTALMVTARACSAMATELGSMRVTEQIDAMVAMAVDPVKYLIMPRVIAATLMTPVLYMVFLIIGMTGSYLVGVVMLEINEGTFLSKIKWFMDAPDMYQGLIKSAIFGYIISLVGCYMGFKADGGARGVGIATTRAVVIGSVAVMIIDYFLTFLFFKTW